MRFDDIEIEEERKENKKTRPHGRIIPGHLRTVSEFLIWAGFVKACRTKAPGILRTRIASVVCVIVGADIHAANGILSRYLARKPYGTSNLRRGEGDETSVFNIPEPTGKMAGQDRSEEYRREPAYPSANCCTRSQP